MGGCLISFFGLNMRGHGFFPKWSLTVEKRHKQEYVVEKIHEIKMGFAPDGNELIRIVRVEWADVSDNEKWSWEPADALTETDAYKEFMSKPAQKLWRNPKYTPADLGSVKPGPFLNQTV